LSAQWRSDLLSRPAFAERVMETDFAVAEDVGLATFGLLPASSVADQEQPMAAGTPGTARIADSRPRFSARGR